MENQYYQYYHLSFNQHYIHLADVFTRFCLKMGQLNPAILTDYIPHIHLERQLTYLGLSFSSSFIIIFSLAHVSTNASSVRSSRSFPRASIEKDIVLTAGVTVDYIVTPTGGTAYKYIPVCTTCSRCTLYLPMEPSRSSIYLSPIPVTFIISSYNLSRPILNNTHFKGNFLHCFI